MTVSLSTSLLSTNAVTVLPFTNYVVSYSGFTSSSFINGLALGAGMIFFVYSFAVYSSTLVLVLDFKGIVVVSVALSLALILAITFVKAVEGVAAGAIPAVPCRDALAVLVTDFSDSVNSFDLSNFFDSEGF